MDYFLYLFVVLWAIPALSIWTAQLFVDTQEPVFP